MLYVRIIVDASLSLGFRCRGTVVSLSDWLRLVLGAGLMYTARLASEGSIYQYVRPYGDRTQRCCCCCMHMRCPLAIRLIPMALVEAAQQLVPQSFEHIARESGYSGLPVAYRRHGVAVLPRRKRKPIISEPSPSLAHSDRVPNYLFL